MQDKAQRVEELRRAGLSETKIQALIFEDASYAMAYQRSTSQRAWNALRCATPRRVRRNKL